MAALACLRKASNARVPSWSTSRFWCRLQ